MATSLSRKQYAMTYGPTLGDRLRLADTNLVIEIEADDNQYGNEILGGQGKTDRERAHTSSRVSRDVAADIVITNVVLLDPVLGIRKTNIGIKDGRILAVGRAGTPATTDSPDILLDSETGIIPGEGSIVTAGGIDTHVHMIQPALMHEALSSGLTTLIAMGFGVFDMGSNPASMLQRSLESFEATPMNIGLLARASSESDGRLDALLAGGAAGFKIHEDKGAYPEVIDATLRAADRNDVQVSIHTDGLNESGFVEDTISAIDGRSIHAFHIDGAGGGHVPDTLLLANEPNVLTSSTTPTIPLGINAEAEHLDMIRTVHRMKQGFPEDTRVAAARIRLSTMAAENQLHDLGAVHMMTSDAQGMGRMGEAIRRTWQLAHARKALSGMSGRNDNARVLRYLAKYTSNPAIAHGISHEVGTVAPGLRADLVLWQPQFFGIRPTLVLKSGYPAWSALPNGNASIRQAMPRNYRPHWGAAGTSPASLSCLFVAGAGLEQGRAGTLPTARELVAVHSTRHLTHRDMLHNQHLASVQVDPLTHNVWIDGQAVEIQTVAELPLNQLYGLT